MTSIIFNSALRSITCFQAGRVLTNSRTLAGLSAAKTRIELNTRPSEKPTSYDDLAFGSVFTDHMLTIEWNSKEGFQAPLISPFQNLSLHPAASSLHYSLQLFEGMKAYRSTRTGSVQMFRPQKNMRRLNLSAERIALPKVDEDEFLQCIAQLINVDRDWVPHSRKASLYIRPTYISTQPTLGVSVANHALLFVILSPVGPYFKTGSLTPVSLMADPRYIRAWEYGTGNYKLGGNYGPTIGIQEEAEKHGCQQLLWLYGENHRVTEVGAMNMFFLWTNNNGDQELVTPTLDSLILPGVTRQSILELTSSWNEFPVIEREITMPEVHQAALDGRLHEVFGAGTACVVCPVGSIKYKRSPSETVEIDIPFNEETSLVKRIYNNLTAIQYDEVDSEWSISLDNALNSSLNISRGKADN